MPAAGMAAERSDIMTNSSEEPANDSSPAIGLNENVTIHDVQYHVQTEDLGVGTHLIRTHVFVNGTVHKVYEVDYSALLGSPNLRLALSRTLKTFHVKVIRRMQAGTSVPSIGPCVTIRTDAIRAITARKSPAQIWDSVSRPAHFAAEPVPWDEVVAKARQEGAASSSTIAEFDELVQDVLHSA